MERDKHEPMTDSRVFADEQMPFAAARRHDPLRTARLIQEPEELKQPAGRFPSQGHPIPSSERLLQDGRYHLVEVQ